MTATLLAALFSAFTGGFLLPIVKQWLFGSDTEQAVTQKLDAEAAAARAEEQAAVRAAADEAAKAHADNPTSDAGYLPEFMGKDP